MFLLLVVAITLGGHDHIWEVTWHLKTKTPKTQAACVFLQWNKCLKVECIQMPKTDVWVCCDLHYQKSNDVIKFLWRHNFFNKVHFNISIRSVFCIWMYSTFWGFVPSEKDASCLSFRSFCFQVTWLTKYGHDYWKWWQPPIEETWPKTNPGILRELKIWRLEVIHSNHFELFCS